MERIRSERREIVASASITGRTPPRDSVSTVCGLSVRQC